MADEDLVFPAKERLSNEEMVSLLAHAVVAMQPTGHKYNASGMTLNYKKEVDQVTMEIGFFNKPPFTKIVISHGNGSAFYYYPNPPVNQDALVMRTRKFLMRMQHIILFSDFGKLKNAPGYVPPLVIKV